MEELKNLIQDYDARRRYARSKAEDAFENNVEAWRSAGYSIPSVRLTAVDFYLQFNLRLFAQ